MHNKNNISFLMAELRKELRLSLVAFSKQLGCSPTHIKRMEVGTVIPEEEFINSICNVYQVNPAYFKGEMDINDAVSVPDSNEEKIQVGKRLKQARKEKGKTLKQLSKEVSLADSSLCFIEAGENRLKENRAEDIAEALEVGVEWLLHGDETKKDDPVNHRMIEWLWKHPEIRKEIWNQIHKETEEQ